MEYPLAPQGVFWTAQGEGVLLGTPMIFVRLAGCSIGCADCDTDYTVATRATARVIVRQAVDLGGAKWVWITGGEPTIHDLRPLVSELRKYDFRIAVATAGVNPVQVGAGRDIEGGVDFVSVSPHFVSDRWLLRRGDQLNVVPGLNGLRLSDFENVDVSGFSHKFVTPFWYGAADRMEKVAECEEWLRWRPDWRLGIQAHKQWGLP